MVETLNDLTRASYPHLIALRPKDGVSLALPACESTADGQSLASESDPCCCNVLEWGGGFLLVLECSASILVLLRLQQ